MKLVPRPGHPLGIYLHLPFCAEVCHYCDFAKTALHDGAQRQRYMTTLAAHLRAWLEVLGLHARRAPYHVPSVFLGGGTPSLLTSEWRPVMELLQPVLGEGAEVSLEANPEHITEDALRLWRDLGINRLSLGVQTFQPEGLRFLTRTHSRESATAAVERALRVFPNLNLDLIYSWPGATPAQWRDDLEHAVRLGVPHLSLYNLTYAEGTVIGRREKRGLVQAPPDEDQAQFYHLAREILASAGFLHEEVSNWCRPGFSCRHNWLYWQNGYYLGIGSGAHGYLEDGSDIGLRYAYPRAWQTWQAPNLPAMPQEIPQALPAFGVQVDDGRTRESWLLEFVGAGLRTELGVALDKVQRVTGRQFKPRPWLAEGLQQGLLIKTADERLILRTDEWFRETAWATEVVLSFVESSVKI